LRIGLGAIEQERRVALVGLLVLRPELEVLFEQRDGFVGLGRVGGGRLLGLGGALFEQGRLSADLGDVNAVGGGRKGKKDAEDDEEPLPAQDATHGDPSWCFAQGENERRGRDSPPSTVAQGGRFGNRPLESSLRRRP